MGDSSTLDGTTTTVDLAGKIMVIGIIVLFLVVLFVMFLHLYAKWYWWRTEVPLEQRWQQRRQRHLVFIPEAAAAAASLQRGLDPDIIKSLPIQVFHGKDFELGLECAVCLCDLMEGEKARMLPKCNHIFHVDCIDTWFRSHATCPLCRNPVDAVQLVEDSSVVEMSHCEIMIAGE